MATVLTATQQVPVAVEILDKKGNPAQVQDPKWEASEPGVLAVTPDPADPSNGLKCLVSAVGPMDDVSLLTFTGDADLGEGVKAILGTAAFQVVAGEAMVVNIVVGTPAEQP